MIELTKDKMTNAIARAKKLHPFVMFLGESFCFVGNPPAIAFSPITLSPCETRSLPSRSQTSDLNLSI